FHDRQSKGDACTVSGISTTQNTALKIIGASGRPNINGNMAKIIGTEPRNPTQDTSTISRPLKPKTFNTGATIAGLAMKTRTRATIRPSSHTSSRDSGLTRSPNTTNIVI